MVASEAEAGAKRRQAYVITGISTLFLLALVVFIGSELSQAPELHEIRIETPSTSLVTVHPCRRTALAPGHITLLATTSSVARPYHTLLLLDCCVGLTYLTGVTTEHRSREPHRHELR